jgi:hypothetical protein
MDTLRNVGIFLLRILLLVFAVVSLLLTARIVIRFFGPSLKDVPGVSAINAIAKGVSIDFPKVSDISTPYGGKFELDTVFSLLLYLLLEALFGGIRRYLETRKEKQFTYYTD